MCIKKSRISGKCGLGFENESQSMCGPFPLRSGLWLTLVLVVPRKPAVRSLAVLIQRFVLLMPPKAIYLFSRRVRFCAGLVFS